MLIIRGEQIEALRRAQLASLRSRGLAEIAAKRPHLLSGLTKADLAVRFEAHYAGCVERGIVSAEGIYAVFACALAFGDDFMRSELWARELLSRPGLSPDEAALALLAEADP